MIPHPLPRVSDLPRAEGVSFKEAYNAILEDADGS